jgi:hypothetical protein
MHQREAIGICGPNLEKQDPGWGRDIPKGCNMELKTSIISEI